jgi:CHAD domain-containing protein
MRKGWTVRPDASLRENARAIIPALLEAFLSQGGDVIAHPSMKKKLHAMRIDGKRVRYGMEIFTEVFGGGYEKKLEEIKTLLDVMGTIHDCDVHLPGIQHRIEEIRCSNRRQAAPAERVRTQGLTAFARELRRRRAELFDEMTKTLQRWEREQFSRTVVHSMSQRFT